MVAAVVGWRIARVRWFERAGLPEFDPLVLGSNGEIMTIDPRIPDKWMTWISTEATCAWAETTAIKESRPIS
jgi:hypothetical protein